jgi:hypothetical protein
MSYTDQDNIEAYLHRDLSESEVNILPLLLSSVDAWINNRTDSSFETPTDPETRYFDGGKNILDINPCIDITAVKYVDAEQNVLVDYDLDIDVELRPRNETLKKWIEKRLSYTSDNCYGKFPSGIANISVTAVFTLSPDSEIPDDIQYLATYLCGRYFGQSNVGELKAESIEGYSRQFKDFEINDPVVSGILDTYIGDTVLF